MSVPMYNPTITWICLTLFLIQSGCATSPRVAAPPPEDMRNTRVAAPPSEDMRNSLGTIGVVSARFTPKVRFQAPTRVRGAGAAAGKTAGRALGGFWGGCGYIMAESTELEWAAFLIVPIVFGGCVVLTPFVAAGGAIHGHSNADATKANRAAKAKHKAEVEEMRWVIDSALGAVAAQKPLQERLLEQAQAGTHHALVSVTGSGPQAPDKRVRYSGLTSEGIDTVLEVTVPRVDFAPDYAFVLTAQARLIRVTDNTELYAGTYTFGTEARTVWEWTANGGDRLAAALVSAYQGLAEKIVDDVFLLRPLPIVRLEADADKQVIEDANDDKDEFKRTTGVISVSGLRPESPRLERLAAYDDAATRLDWPVVDSLQPTLRWEAFPDRQRLGPDADALLARLDNVTYELRIARVESGLPYDVIVSETGLTGPSYRLEQPLEAGSVYWWSVRAHFQLDGKARVTAWSSMVSTSPDDASNALRAAGQLANVPNVFSYRFRTPVETQIFAEVEEHGGTTDVGEAKVGSEQEANLQEIALVKEREQIAPAGSARTEHIVYRIGVFPFAGGGGRNSVRWQKEQTARSLQAQIESDNALALAYSYYDDALNEPRISELHRLWGRKKPNLEVVYTLARDRGLDGVVMAWGRTWDRTSTIIELYLIDIDSRKVYHQKGTTIESRLRRVAKTVFAAFIKGRGHVSQPQPTVGLQAEAPGDADAQFRLGYSYYTGTGVPKDDAHAVTWYRQAAAQGHAVAQYNLGAAYANDRGVEASQYTAAEWFLKAGQSFLKEGKREPALQAVDAIERVVPGHFLAKRLLQDGG